MIYKKDNFFKSLTPGKKYRRARWDIVRYVTKFSDGEMVYVFKEWVRKIHCYRYIALKQSHLEIEVRAGLWATYYHKRKD